MADFQSSSHRAKWIFTPQDLVAKRDAANQRAVKMLEKYGVTRLGVDVDGLMSYPEPLNDLKADIHSLPRPLNCGEEHLMRLFYEQKIQEVCAMFRFPRKIQGTAIIYFKKFYLQWSVMEHHPKHIMLTCIYASCKIEEHYVSAEILGKETQQDHQMILNNEMVVFQSLGFDLIVYAPYRSIEGFGEDIEVFCQRRTAEDNFKILRETAKSEVDRIMMTDAPLLFPPGQLALAGLRRSNEVHRVLDFERYLMSLCSRQQSAHTIFELTDSLNAIDLLVGGLRIPMVNEMKHVDRKLMMCRGPNPQDDCRKKKREKRSKHKTKRAGDQTLGVPEY